MKILVTIAFVFITTSKGYSQQVHTVNSDTTISTTLCINSNTIINLNGHKLILAGVPKLKITNRATLLIKNGDIVDFNNFSEILEGSLEWRTNTSKGSISCCGNGFNGYNALTWLDGVPK